MRAAHTGSSLRDVCSTQKLHKQRGVLSNIHGAGRSGWRKGKDLRRDGDGRARKIALFCLRLLAAILMHY